MAEFDYDKEAYRDTIATVGEDGKRKFIYPKKPKGSYYNKRTYLSYLLLILLFGLPFLKIGGEPLFLFNIIERKFIVFGLIFRPQDFFVFVLSAITAIVGIIVFTVGFGRIWCGWLCPQTIFMEMLFRKIEYWIDGDFGKQKKLAKQKWDGEKFRKRALKFGIFWILSFLIAHTFLSYIIGVDEVLTVVTSPVNENLVGFIALLAFTFIFFGVFWYFREQACIAVCPYGRLQGVLLDKKSIQVSYDYVRGENRGRYRKKEDRKELGKGDCIDCGLCIAVCPTGIDIRNGSQMECVNCTACMDACDSVMEKVNLPKGLIRYASDEMIKESKPFTFNKRLKAYALVLILLITSVTTYLVTRSDVEAIILRMPGANYKKVDTRIMNVYNYKLVNKSHDNMKLSFELLSHDGEVVVAGNQEGIVPVDDQGIAEGSLFIYIPRNQTDSKKTKIRLSLKNGEEEVDRLTVYFSSPFKTKK
ncbi:MAG: cytochrome c oxidase accessory protein CcoG [Flavobacteriales bacterium]|jgi:cytochrome c oxidase accessory protein FixG|nr:cytochrome c oxidase accessory protein CcoG [Flavobacteriales bacterium]